MTPFVPVVAGVAGNLSAIQGSRMSTYLHSIHGKPGEIKEGIDDVILGKRHSRKCGFCPNPISTFFQNKKSKKSYLHHIIFYKKLKFQNCLNSLKHCQFI